jgi:outer membrane protein
VTWDVWDGRLTKGTVREKALELEKTRADLDDAERHVRLQVRQAYLDMAHAGQAVAASAGTVSRAAKALEIARARHKSGLGTYLEFTDANLALSTARLTHLVAMRDHMSAVVALRYATGMPLATPEVGGGFRDGAAGRGPAAEQEK